MRKKSRHHLQIVFLPEAIRCRTTVPTSLSLFASTASPVLPVWVFINQLAANSHCLHVPHVLNILANLLANRWRGHYKCLAYLY